MLLKQIGVCFYFARGTIFLFHIICRWVSLSVCYSFICSLESIGSSLRCNIFIWRIYLQLQNLLFYGICTTAVRKISIIPFMRRCQSILSINSAKIKIKFHILLLQICKLIRIPAWNILLLRPRRSNKLFSCKSKSEAGMMVWYL